MAGQFMFAPETVYGTGVTPTFSLPVLSADPGNGIPGRIPRDDIIGGQFFRDAGKPGLVTCAPSIEFSATNANGMAMLLHHSIGAVVVDDSEDPVFSRAYSPGSLKGKSLTAQVGVTDASDTVRPFTATGWKIAQLGLGVTVGQNAKWKLTGPAQKVVTATALAVASVEPDEAFTCVEGLVSVDGDPLTTCRTVNVDVNRNPRASRHVLHSQYILEPLDDAYWDGTGTIEMDFESLAMYNHALAADELSFSLAFVSGNGIDSMDLEMEIQLDGDQPKLDSIGLQPQSLKFTAFGADALAATLVNRETLPAAA